MTRKVIHLEEEIMKVKVNSKITEMNEPFKDTSDHTNSSPVSKNESLSAGIDKSIESNKDKFKCDKCDYKCKKEVTLKKHMNIKHDDQQCKVYSKTFVSTIDLLQHIAKEHSSNDMTHMSSNESHNPDKV